ncbi:MAG: antibiotic biosynthesis monooxygenase, partial [Anaerolineae bacterium]|nr:antibiotic biosynthesis monooxygenase [Anaerolineae bacterium]
MYGTVAKLRVKPGQLEAFKAWAEVAESRPVPGFISTTIYQMDSDPQ